MSTPTASSPDTERVTVDVTDGVAQVRLARPAKMNALDMRMFRALAETGQSIGADRSIRSVVLAGEGRAFCAGLDMAVFSALAGDDGASGGAPAAEPTPAPDAAPTGLDGSLVERLPGRPSNLAQEAAQVWQDLPQPVVAAIHGPAFGGGLQIALGADIRFAAADAKLSVMEIRWGLLPDMTGPQALVRLCGLDVAKELVLTGRRLSGDEALALGLVTHVVDDPLAAATALAVEIAGRNPEAVQGAKALLNAAGTRPLQESLEDESRRMQALLGSPNQVEAVMAELEGRAAVFSDPT